MSKEKNLEQWIKETVEIWEADQVSESFFDSEKAANAKQFMTWLLDQGFEIKEPKNWPLKRNYLADIRGE